jgi:hypothetical protein
VIQELFHRVAGRKSSDASLVTSCFALMESGSRSASVSNSPVLVALVQPMIMRAHARCFASKVLWLRLLDDWGGLDG